MGAYLIWDGGSLHFDAVLNETVTLSATITEHPVERGANIADHIRAEVDRVRLDVFVSNVPIEDVNGRGASVQPTSTGINDVNVLRFLQPFDAPRETIAQLTELRDKGTLVEVATHARYLESMAVESVESRPKGDSAELTISLKQIRLVSTKTVDAPKPKQPRDQKKQSKGSQQLKPKKKVNISGAALLFDKVTGG